MPEMKVVFIQPGQFLRTSRKTNPFFDPIIEVCQKNGIDWELYLPSVQVENGVAGIPKLMKCHFGD